MRPHQFLLLLAMVLFTGNMAQARVVYDQSISGVEYSVGFLLSWSTTSELNSENFVVERSIDNGLTYSEIGVVKAVGNETTGSEYTFKDLELGLSNAYYRLREIEKDGTNSLSEFISLQKSIIHNYMVTNTEMVEKNKYELTIKSITESTLLYQLNDALGEVVQKDNLPISPGLNTLLLNMEFEAPGDYSLSLKMDNDLEVLFLKKEEDQESKKKMASKKQGKGW